MRLWESAEALRRAIGVPLPLADRAIYDRYISAVHSELLAMGYAKDTAMTPEQAIAYGLDEAT